MSCNFCLFFNFFCPKNVFLKFLNGALFLWTLWVFLLGFPNFKMILVTLNTSFHIDFDRFVGDWTCIIQKINIITFFKVTTMSIWIILKNLIWTCRECKFYRYWAIIVCIYLLFVFFFYIWCSHMDVHFWFSMLILFSFFTSNVHTWRCVKIFLCFFSWWSNLVVR
jgi:hypothetical protein